jgi:hypothetical protein
LNPHPPLQALLPVTFVRPKPLPAVAPAPPLPPVKRRRARQAWSLPEECQPAAPPLAAPQVPAFASSRR